MESGFCTWNNMQCNLLLQASWVINGGSLLYFTKLWASLISGLQESGDFCSVSHARLCDMWTELFQIMRHTCDFSDKSTELDKSIFYWYYYFISQVFCLLHFLFDLGLKICSHLLELVRYPKFYFIYIIELLRKLLMDICNVFQYQYSH